MKPKSRIAEGLPAYALFAVDLINFVLSVGPGAIAWASLLCFLRHFWESPAFLAWALLSPVVLAAAFLLTVFLLRLCIPRLEKGVYPMSVNRGMLAWYCNLALSRSSVVAGLSSLLNIFYVTKYLHWRALGMKVAFGINSSIGVSFVDLPMIRIGKRCTISEGVHIACHTFVGDKLLVSPVEIGDDVFVGMNCVIGPRTKIGARAWIGMSNLISDVIPAETKLDNFAWERGNPARGPAKD